MNLNKVYLIGRLTRDPELRTTPSGQNVVSFGLATNRVWYNDARQKQEMTEFHNIVAWARLADVINQYCRKGSLLLVEGRLQTRSWQAQDGTNRTRTEVVAENIQLGPRSTGAGEGGGSYQPRQNNPVNSRSVAAPEMPTETLETINLDEMGNPVEEVEIEQIPSEPVPF